MISFTPAATPARARLRWAGSTGNAPASNTGQLAIKGAAVSHWLLGSVYWPGTCTDDVNGASTIAGTVRCGTLSISAGAGARTAVGGNFGINTALVEAVLVE